MLTVANFRGCVRESSIQMRLLNGDAFVFSIQHSEAGSLESTRVAGVEGRPLLPFGSSDLSPSPCLGFPDWIGIHGVASRVVALHWIAREGRPDERLRVSFVDRRPAHKSRAGARRGREGVP